MDVKAFLKDSSRVQCLTYCIWLWVCESRNNTVDGRFVDFKRIFSAPVCSFVSPGNFCEDNFLRQVSKYFSIRTEIIWLK